MGTIIPHVECIAYPIWNNYRVTLPIREHTDAAMATIESKTLLWTSVQGLMRARYGGENLNRLARDAKIGPASASRLKAQETSVGLDVVDKIASAFGVESWQLLVPGFDPVALPDLNGASPMAKDIAAMLDAITDEAHRRRAYALVVQALQFGALQVPEKSPEPAASAIAAPAQHS